MPGSFIRKSTLRITNMEMNSSLLWASTCVHFHIRPSVCLSWVGTLQHRLTTDTVESTWYSATKLASSTSSFHIQHVNKAACSARSKHCTTRQTELIFKDLVGCDYHGELVMKRLGKKQDSFYTEEACQLWINASSSTKEETMFQNPKFLQPGEAAGSARPTGTQPHSNACI